MSPTPKSDVPYKLYKKNLFYRSNVQQFSSHVYIKSDGRPISLPVNPARRHVDLQP
jgi:hypothetical protein